MLEQPGLGLSVSVAMATFNGSKYLSQQLASLASQSYLPSELVISDDGSNDDTLDILRAFKAQAPFPVVIHSNAQRLGYKNNFMRCTSLCSGRLIAFCDQDDIWADNKLANVVDAFQRTQTDLVYHSFDLIDSKGDHLDADRPSGQLFGHPFAQVYGLATVIDRRLTALNYLWQQSCDHFQPAQRMAHDQWFYFLATLSGSFTSVDDSLVSYRQHASNACGFDAPRQEGKGMLSALSGLWHYFVFGDAGGVCQKRQDLADLYRGRATCLLKRLTIGRQIAKSHGELGVRQQQLAAYATMYQSFYLRSLLFSNRSTAVRFRLLWQLVRVGYVSMEKKISLKEILFDLTYGVFVGPVGQGQGQKLVDFG